MTKCPKIFGFHHNVFWRWQNPLYGLCASLHCCKKKTTTTAKINMKQEPKLKAKKSWKKSKKMENDTEKRRSIARNMTAQMSKSISRFWMTICRVISLSTNSVVCLIFFSYCFFSVFIFCWLFISIFSFDVLRFSAYLAKLLLSRWRIKVLSKYYGNKVA